MALTKKKKAEVVENLDGVLKDVQSVVFVNFKGLTVAEAHELRGALRKEGTGYTVAKKTLLKRSLAKLSPAGVAPDMAGEIAIAYGNDPVAPARGIHSFAKAHEGHLAIEGGIFEGAYKSRDEMRAIALIPSLDTLRAQFVNLINSPIRAFAVVLNQIAESPKK